MKVFGIFEVKTKFSEICDMVNENQETVLVTKRGIPFVKLEPVTDSDKSDIWKLREKFIQENGSFDKEISVPERTIEKIKDIF